MKTQKNSDFKAALVNPFIYPPLWPNLILWEAWFPIKSPDVGLVGLGELNFSKKLWDMGSSKTERLKRLQEATLQRAREIGLKIF